MKIERRTLAEQAYLNLRAEILNEEYSAGAELQEVRLAERYGVSRGPIREALRRLSAEGLVTLTPRRGATVRALGPQDFRDAYRVREVLEVLAVELAVPLLTAADLAELSRHLDTINQAVAKGDMELMFQGNRKFHGLFVEKSGNATLQTAYRQVVDLIGRHGRRTVGLRGNLADLSEEHRRIFEAAERKDAQGAAEATRRHIRVPVERLIMTKFDADGLDERRSEAAAVIDDRRVN